MSRLRWRLARWFAPVPIMRDPFPPEGGVVVMYRSGTEYPFRVEWSLRADRFRLKSTTKPLRVMDYGEDDFTVEPSQSFTRFVGTLGGAL